MAHTLNNAAQVFYGLRQRTLRRTLSTSQTDIDLTQFAGNFILIKNLSETDGELVHWQVSKLEADTIDAADEATDAQCGSILPKDSEGTLLPSDWAGYRGPRPADGSWLHLKAETGTPQITIYINATAPFGLASGAFAEFVASEFDGGFTV